MLAPSTLAPASSCSTRIRQAAAIAGASRAPQLAPSIAIAPDTPGVYLLAFVYRGAHVPYGAGASPHAGALHYLGFARDSIARRVREHATGRGARLTLAAFLAGYELRLVRVWAGAGRERERRLKASHALARYCPLCRYQLDAAPLDTDPAPATLAELLAAEAIAAAAGIGGGRAFP